jgi:hypothetical protein
MKSNRVGYTLLELVIASLLVMVVLYGLYTTISSLTNFEVEGVRKGSVDSWTNAALAQMTREIENADLIMYPSAANPQTTQVYGCTNWSNKAGSAGTGGPLDTTNPTVTKFYYCLDTTSGPSSPGGGPIAVMRRMAISGVGLTCDAVNTAGPACTSGSPLGAGSTNDVIATQVSAPAGYVFSYTATNAVTVNFVVGDPNPTTVGANANTPSNARIINPQTTTVNTTIQFRRAYLNSSD